MLDPKERFRKYSLRSVFDGILYIVRTGVQWRMLPSDFAPWQTVYYYFSKWKNEVMLEEIVYHPTADALSVICLLLQSAPVHRGTVQEIPGEQTAQPLRLHRLPHTHLHAPEIELTKHHPEKCRPFYKCLAIRHIRNRLHFSPCCERP